MKRLSWTSISNLRYTNIAHSSVMPCIFLPLAPTTAMTRNSCTVFFELSTTTKTPLVATNDVHYHIATRRELQDIVTCIREKCTIQTAGYRLHENAERYLKESEEMFRLFLKYPAAIWRAQEIADACTFSLNELEYRYPKEINTSGRTPLEQLRYLT